MKVLVTGASGLYGRAVAASLLARGDDVVVMQRRTAELDGAREVLGDITDRAALVRAVAGREAVIHLAARVGVVGARADFDRVNVQGTAALLRAAREAGVGRMVYVSSPSVAHRGDPLVGAGAEPADAEHARGHYARSKAAGERLALGPARGRPHPPPDVVAIRPHLVWGPGDTQLIGRIVERARAGRLPLINGGTALIDTTYLDNAVEATVAALDRARRLAGRALVVSNGEPRTVRELFTLICRAAGLPAPRRRVPAWAAGAAGHAAETLWLRLGREDDPPMTAFLAEQLATAHWFDQRETRAALDWTPRVPLAVGFDRLARSYRDGAVGRS